MPQAPAVARVEEGGRIAGSRLRAQVDATEEGVIAPAFQSTGTARELDAGVLRRVRVASLPVTGEVDPEEVRLDVIGVDRREKSTLVQLRARGSSRSADLILKLAKPARDRGGPDRPRLAVPGAVAERSRREHDALVRLEAHLRSNPDPRFSTVRSLGWFSGPDGLLTERFQGANLRQLIRREVGRPALPAFGRRRSTWPAARTAVENAGAWLAMFHRAMSDPDADGREAGSSKARQSTRAELRQSARRLSEYLAAAVGPVGYFEAVGDEIERRIESKFPESLPLAIAHGDFAPRNVLVTHAGTVAALDIAGFMRAPIYEDIAYFAASLATPTSVAIARGWTQDAAGASALKDAFVEAYFSPAPPTWDAVRVYEVLVLLDRWCGRPPAAPRSLLLRPLVGVARTLVDRHLRAEVDRLLSA